MNRQQRRLRERRTERGRGIESSIFDRFSEQEIANRLVAALAMGGTFSENDRDRAADWVDSVKLDYGLLACVVNGAISMRWDEEKQDWVFGAIEDGKSQKLAKILDEAV